MLDAEGAEALGLGSGSLVLVVSVGAGDLGGVVGRGDLFPALAEGFLDGAGDRLGTAERSLLVTAAQVITYEQAARFLADYLAGDVYYRTTPDRPLHNLERARAQLALLMSFEQRFS